MLRISSLFKEITNARNNHDETILYRDRADVNAKVDTWIYMPKATESNNEKAVESFLQL